MYNRSGLNEENTILRVRRHVGTLRKSSTHDRRRGENVSRCTIATWLVRLRDSRDCFIPGKFIRRRVIVNLKPGGDELGLVYVSNLRYRGEMRPFQFPFIIARHELKLRRIASIALCVQRVITLYVFSVRVKCSAIGRRQKAFAEFH